MAKKAAKKKAATKKASTGKGRRRKPRPLELPPGGISPSDGAHGQLAVEDLVERKADYNPRKMSKHDAERLRESMREFGVVEPVIVNIKTGNVVGGHQRIDAAAEMKLETMPVRFVDLSDEQEKALNVALNRISGEWAYEDLSEILGDLPQDMLALTGMRADELETLLAAEWNPDRSAVPPPEAAQEVVAKEGGMAIALDKDVAALVRKVQAILQDEAGAEGDQDEESVEPMDVVRVTCEAYLAARKRSAGRARGKTKTRRKAKAQRKAKRKAG